MIRRLTIVTLLVSATGALSGCATTQQDDSGLWSRVGAAVAGVLDNDREPLRDNEQREQLALVAPQEIVEPEDPELRKAIELREVYYKSHDPLYPGIHYAAGSAED